MLLTRGRRARRVAVIATVVAVGVIGTTVAAQATSKLKKGQTVYYIPKDTLNPYEVIADRGGKLALTAIGNKQVVQSGTKDTAAAQLPAIQTAIQTGANAIVIAGNDPAALCPQLKQAMAKGIAVVTFDSDTNCRQLFINQADTETIGRSQIQQLGKEMHYTGEFAILSAASTASNQNAWIKFMKIELKKFPKVKLVSTVYGNDDPTTATQVTQGLLQHFPKLKGIISPTTVGILAAAQVVDAAGDKGKVLVTGLGTPLEMKKYILNGTSPDVILWNPANLGYLAAYAAVELASRAITNAQGQSFVAGKLGKFSVGAGHTILLGAPFVFNKANIDKFNF